MWIRFKPWLKGAAVLATAALCLYLILPIQSKIKLGLDLQGGVRVLLQLHSSPEIPKITPQVQGQVEFVLQNRVNGLGVSEPVISPVGSDRILVELPNVKNPDEAIRTLKDVAKLDFKIMPESVYQRAEREPKYAADPNGAYQDSGPIVYSGADLKAAQASFDQTGRPNILFQTKKPAEFGKMTQANMHRWLAIFLDKQYKSAATIEGVITDSGEIHGSFTAEDTTRIANELNAGALPVAVTVIENDTVGPILGKIDLEKSLIASIIGLTLVSLFMIFVYRLPGFMAVVALAVYVLMLLGLLAGVKAVLTLPGIAGFVLSIGMAVDANVLIFERLKEELWSGKSLRAAVQIGFRRAFTAVFDSHVTTIVGAGVLFMLGTGTVKGFAYTLFWGTVFSLVTAVFITRYFMDLVVDNDLVTNEKAYGV
jgi:preprotein translocase subunit SecD